MVKKVITSDDIVDATDVASALELEPVIIQDTPPASPATINNGNDST
jgi:hypothetical protein